ncbi:MAG: gliding motility lipoprotein GldH [Bacteroidaceae bacterium]
MTRIKKYMMASTLLILVSACLPSTLFHSFLSVNLNGWERGDTLVFKPIVNDSISNKQVLLEVRNTTKYAYTSLLLCMECRTNNQVTRIDTFNYPITNEQGTWKGAGNIYKQSALLLYNHYTPHTEYRIWHCMGDEKVKGIESIGLHIKRK